MCYEERDSELTSRYPERYRFSGSGGRNSNQFEAPRVTSLSGTDLCVGTPSLGILGQLQWHGRRGSNPPTS